MFNIHAAVAKLRNELPVTPADKALNQVVFDWALQSNYTIPNVRSAIGRVFNIIKEKTGKIARIYNGQCTTMWSYKNFLDGILRLETYMSLYRFRQNNLKDFFKNFSVDINNIDFDKLNKSYVAKDINNNDKECFYLTNKLTVTFPDNNFDDHTLGISAYMLGGIYNPTKYKADKFYLQMDFDSEFITLPVLVIPFKDRNAHWTLFSMLNNAKLTDEPNSQHDVIITLYKEIFFNLGLFKL